MASGFRKFALVLSLVLLASCATPVSRAPASRAPASVWSDCRELFQNLVARKKPDPYLADPETARARAAMQSLEADCQGVTMPEEYAYFAISETLKPSEFEALFKKIEPGSEDRYLHPNEFEGRMQKVVGERTSMFGVADQLKGSYSQQHVRKQSVRGREREAEAFQAIKSKLEKAAAKSDAEKEALRREIQKRQRLAKLDQFIEDPSLFEAAVGEKQITFPDGTAYPVLKKRADGTVVVGIPYSNIMKTQDYFNGAIEAQYRGDPTLKKMEFEGTWLPDGRIVILDQHHRTSAYRSKIGDPVPFILKPGADGKYRSLSYAYAMKFYTAWGGIPESRRLELLETIEKTRADSALARPDQDQKIRKLLESLYRESLRLGPPKVP
jgi:hypothetical protein